MPTPGNSKLPDIMDVIADTMDSDSRKPSGVRVNGKTIQKLKDELAKTGYVGMGYGFEEKDQRPMGNIVVHADGSIEDDKDDENLVGYFWDTPVHMDESLQDGEVEVDYPKDPATAPPSAP